MGFSGRFVFRQRSWVDGADTEDGDLTIDIHDSDIATLAYEPSSGQGFFYLGFQPRDYFEDEEASARFDLDAEASAFASWANEVLDVEMPAGQIRPLLADDEEEEPDDDFVEETVGRLLSLLRLPLPPGFEPPPE
jgi:hypothetical protein